MTPLMYAAKNGCARVVALLVAHGSRVNAQDEHGYSVSDSLLRVVINDKNSEKQEPKNLFLRAASQKYLPVCSAFTPFADLLAFTVFVAELCRVRTYAGCVIRSAVLFCVFSFALHVALVK